MLYRGAQAELDDDAEEGENGARDDDDEDDELREGKADGAEDEVEYQFGLARSWQQGWATF